MPATLPAASALGVQTAVAQAHTSAIAARLLQSEDFLTQLTDEVQELLFTTSLRQQLRLALVQTLGKRMELHAAACATLELARAELNQPWRHAHGGKDGAPTPTPHLVMVAGEAHQEVQKTEDALLKAIKLAVDEQRSNKELAHSEARPAFSGEAETIPVPPSLPAHERETIRTLFGLLRQEAAARVDTVDVRSRPPEPAPTIDVTPAQTSAPVREEPFGIA